MVDTGYISFITETGGGFDDSGNPIATVKEKSTFVACNLNTVKREYKTFVNGQYQQVKYSIIIDNYRIKHLDLSNLIEISLSDSHLNSLGNFQVQNKEYLNISQKLKIVV